MISRLKMNCNEKYVDKATTANDSNSERPFLAQCFTRVDDVDSLSPDDFIDRFERYGFLWFKAKSTAMPTMPTGKQILDFVKDHSSACETSWTIENHSKDTMIPNSSLMSRIIPENLIDFTGTRFSFYASTIVHRNVCKLEESNEDESNQKLCSANYAHQSLMKMLPRFDTVFEDIYENGDPPGTWLFLGHHGVSNTQPKTKKRRVGGNTASSSAIDDETKTTTLLGRAEHVDEVTHSGTYHIQISGTKTWKIRPHPDSFLADEFNLDSTEAEGGSRIQEIEGFECSDKYWRIKINVEEGDVFVLNTKIWYHCTELNRCSNKSSSEWSISVAHDFYLPIPCPRDVKEGDIVYGHGNFNGHGDDNIEDDGIENDLVDPEIPDELPRSDNPNCVLVEVDTGRNNSHDTDYDDDDYKIALVALRDIPEGEPLSIAFDAEHDQLGNANEQIDPRVISKRSWKKNEIVVRGEDRMPPDTCIPRSHEPNCELVQVEGTCLALRALVDIPEGGVFCILPEDDEEYEEVEVDLETGELV